MAFLVENESAKLYANAFDRASTGCFLFGVFSPMAGLTYGAPLQVDPTDFVISMLLWFFAGILLHYVGQQTISTLQE